MKKYLAILLGFLLSASPAYAAIAYDSSASYVADTVSSITYSETNSGNFVNICVEEYVNPGAVDKITSVTYGGMTATAVKKIQVASYLFLQDYVVLNAPTGANNTIITASSSINEIAGMTASYSGVDTTTGYDNEVSGSQNNVTSLSVALTPGHANDWVLTCFSDNGNTFSSTIPSGGVARQTTNCALDNCWSYSDTNGTVAQSSIAYGQNRNGSASSGRYLYLINLSIFPGGGAPTATAVSPYFNSFWW